MNIGIINDRLKENHCLPANWEWYSWSCFPKGEKETLYVEFQGCIGDALFKSGKQKGKPNYKECSGHRKFYVTPAQAATWESDWSKKTGGCVSCTGTGKRPIGWSRQTGADFIECPKCNGTGKHTEALEGAVK